MMMHKLTLMFQLFAPVTAELELFMSSKDVHEKPAIVFWIFIKITRENSLQEKEKIL